MRFEKEEKEIMEDEMKKTGKHILIGKKVMDSENNIFTITKLTFDREGYHNGFALRGEAGEKEISKHDLKFYGFWV